MSSGLDAKTPLRGFLYGGVASVIAEICTTPMDVVKVRMQLQGEVGGSRQYTSVVDAFVKIVRQDGPAGLFKGLKPAVLRQMSYGTIRVGLYPQMKKAFGVDGEHQSAPLRKIAAGMASGSIAAAATNPTDVIKVRMMANRRGPNMPPLYDGVAHAFWVIFKQEGFRGFYKGVLPTMTRASIVTAADIASYDEIKSAFVRTGAFAPDQASLHFTTALMSGFIATVFSSPFDVLKSRLMAQPYDASGRGKLYSGMADCLVKCVRAEGWRFGFNGFVPNYLCKGPTMILFFMIYEQIRIIGDAT